MSVAKDFDGVSFLCVDYGNIVNVDFKSVHTLMPCFRKLPSLAIKAELAGKSEPKEIASYKFFLLNC